MCQLELTRLVLERGNEAAKGKGIMERSFTIGCRVVFFDSKRRPHEALVTSWFHGGPDGETIESWRKRNGTDPHLSGPVPDKYLPCCNLVYVSGDDAKHDPYGRQTERDSSVTYGRAQSTPFLGRCWCWPDEVEEAMALAAKSYDEAVAK